MSLLLIFSVTLLVAVLISGLAQRSVLSTAVLFLVVGFVLGRGVFGFAKIDAQSPAVTSLAQLALFSVLFTDGMRMGLHDLVSARNLPGRALLLGLPLTLAGIALLAHFLVGLPWLHAFLLGAALSPTDPVFASAIVGQEGVPGRLRRLLNVESGLNDGLALPMVMIILHVLGAANVNIQSVSLDLVFGVLLGIALPWMILKFESLGSFKSATEYEPFNAFALGLLIYGVALTLGINLYLAAFVGGITITSTSKAVRDAFKPFGERLTELLKLAALLMFGAFISPDVLSGTVQISGYIFAALTIFLVRPVALSIALLGADFDRREWLVAAWFGPRGFASIIYGLLILNSGISQGDYIFHLIALVVAGSILVNSTTDILAVGWLRDMGVRPYYRLPSEVDENEPDAQRSQETTTNHPNQR